MDNNQALVSCSINDSLTKLLAGQISCAVAEFGTRALGWPTVCLLEPIESFGEKERGLGGLDTHLLFTMPLLPRCAVL